MQDDPQPSLEAALEHTERDAQAVLKTATAAASAVKRFRAAAQNGNLRDLRPSIEAAEQVVSALGQQLANAKQAWDFDESAYFSSGAFQRELLETARRQDVRIFEQDDRLYCYPNLVRVVPDDRAVLIEKTRERRVRPTVLVRLLRELQKRPARFKPQDFLETLFSAYQPLTAPRGKDQFDRGHVVRLLDIYDLLTLLPGASRDYSKPEFARDIYLLDRSGVTRTKKELRVVFSASTGTKSSSGTLRVITEDGEERLYYGIAFEAR